MGPSGLLTTRPRNTYDRLANARSLLAVAIETAQSQNQPRPTDSDGSAAVAKFSRNGVQQPVCLSFHHLKLSFHHGATWRCRFVTVILFVSVDFRGNHYNIVATRGQILRLKCAKFY